MKKAGFLSRSGMLKAQGGFYVDENASKESLHMTKNARENSLNWYGESYLYRAPRISIQETDGEKNPSSTVRYGSDQKEFY